MSRERRGNSCAAPGQPVLSSYAKYVIVRLEPFLATRISL